MPNIKRDSNVHLSAEDGASEEGSTEENIEPVATRFTGT